MLKTIQKFFLSCVDSAGKAGQPERQGHALHLAAAVLAIEMIRADHVVEADERHAAMDALRGMFGLDESEAHEILALAESEADDAVSLHEFTQVINEGLDRGQKIELVELLWRVAMSDSMVDKYEEYLLRKVADLLYVSHGDFIQARHRAQAAVGEP